MGGTMEDAINSSLGDECDEGKYFANDANG